MTFKTLNFNYSTKPSIIYIACCKIVLMFYKILNINSAAVDRPHQGERTSEITPTANGRGTCQAVLFIFIVISTDY